MTQHIDDATPGLDRPALGVEVSEAMKDAGEGILSNAIVEGDLFDRRALVEQIYIAMARQGRC